MCKWDAFVLLDVGAINLLQWDQNQHKLTDAGNGALDTLKPGQQNSISLWALSALESPKKLTK